MKSYSVTLVIYPVSEPEMNNVQTAICPDEEDNITHNGKKTAIISEIVHLGLGVKPPEWGMGIEKELREELDRPSLTVSVAFHEVP